MEIIVPLRRTLTLNVSVWQPHCLKGMLLICRRRTTKNRLLSSESVEPVILDSLTTLCTSSSWFSSISTPTSAHWVSKRPKKRLLWKRKRLRRKRRRDWGRLCFLPYHQASTTTASLRPIRSTHNNRRDSSKRPSTTRNLDTCSLKTRLTEHDR